MQWRQNCFHRNTSVHSAHIWIENEFLWFNISLWILGVFHSELNVEKLKWYTQTQQET